MTGFSGFQANGYSIRAENREKLASLVLQPISFKSDRLLAFAP